MALLELAGPGATALLQARWSGGAWPAPGSLAVGRLLDAEGALLDEVVLARAEEERYELSCHGGPALVTRVVVELSAAGAAPLEAPTPAPGEDPLRAAALAALPRARTALGAQVLLRQAAGALRSGLESALLALEREPAAGVAALAELRAQARLGRALLEPARVVLLGLPSAGKSSLLNALLGRERALVSPEPGTTRDLLEAPLELEGLPLLLVDAAGQRPSPDELEAEAVQRAAAAAARADLRLVVIDAAAPDEAARELAARALPPRLLLLNKADLLSPAAALQACVWAGASAPEAPPLLVSARTGQGLDALGRAVRAVLVGPAGELGPVPFDAAQAATLELAAQHAARGALDLARGALTALLSRAPGA